MGRLVWGYLLPQWPVILVGLGGRPRRGRPRPAGKSDGAGERVRPEMSAKTLGSHSCLVVTSGGQYFGVELIRLERPRRPTASLNFMPSGFSSAPPAPCFSSFMPALDGARVRALLPAPSNAGRFRLLASLSPIRMGVPASYNSMLALFSFVTLPLGIAGGRCTAMPSSPVGIGGPASCAGRGR